MWDWLRTLFGSKPPEPRLERPAVRVPTDPLQRAAATFEPAVLVPLPPPYPDGPNFFYISTRPDVLLLLCRRCNGKGMTSDADAVTARLNAAGIPPERHHLNVYTGEARTEPMLVHCPDCEGRGFRRVDEA